MGWNHILEHMQLTQPTTYSGITHSLYTTYSGINIHIAYYIQWD